MPWPDVTTQPSAMVASTRPRLDPAHILGCSLEEAVQLFHGRPVTPGEAEAIAELAYDWRAHLHDPASYWVTVAQAAEILGMSPSRVKRLLDHHRLPCMHHVSGVRLMRRHQLMALQGLYGGPASAVAAPVVPVRRQQVPGAR